MREKKGIKFSMVMVQNVSETLQSWNPILQSIFLLGFAKECILLAGVKYVVNHSHMT
jgi:hypothetical protein